MPPGSTAFGKQDHKTSRSSAPWRLARHFLVGAAILIPVGGLLGSVVLGASALLYAEIVGGAGWWASLEAGSVTAVYLLAGLAGGGLLGALIALSRALAMLEDELRARLPGLVELLGESDFPSMPPQELRVKYEQLLERMFRETVGRIGFPGWLARFICGRVRAAAVEDFLADCKARGVARVGASEIAAWLANKGVGLAMRPTHVQLGSLRVFVSTVLGLMCAGIVGLAVFRISR